MTDGPARLADADDAAEVTRLRVEMLRELAGHDATGSADESADVLSDAISSGDWLGCSVVDGDVGLLSCGVVYLTGGWGRRACSSRRTSVPCTQILLIGGGGTVATFSSCC